MPFPRKCPSQKGRHSQGDALHTEGVQYFSQERMPDKNKKRHSHGGPSQGHIHLPWFFSWEWREKRALFVFHTFPKEKCQTNKKRHSHGGPSQRHIHLPWFFFGDGERKKNALQTTPNRKKPDKNKKRHCHGGPSQGRIHLPWFSPGNGERKKAHFVFHTLDFPQEKNARQKQETPLPWRATSGAHSPTMVFTWKWREKKNALCFSMRATIIVPLPV